MMPPGISSTEPLQFHLLGEYPFQNLCRDLFDAEPEIAVCEVYGSRGQSQDGIDLIAHRKNDNGTEVGQCKCYNRFSPGQIKTASDEFFKYWNRWSKENVKRFILFVACDLSDRHCQDRILLEKKRFSECGVKYEAWSSSTIKNKLRPYPNIVRSFLPKHSDYWVSEICGIAPPTFQPSFGLSPQATYVITALTAHTERLAGRLSTETENQLEVMREAWREGRRGAAVQWVKNQKSNRPIWESLAPQVRSKILRFESSLVFDVTGDLSQVRLLADEAKVLSPSDDQSRLRALIQLKETGPTDAAKLLEGKDDIDSMNLRAGLALELGHIDESRSILDQAMAVNEPNAETFRLRALSYVLTRDMAQARLEIQKALEIRPQWKSVREAAGMISYLSSLSPAAIPKGIIVWPEPIDWSLVKRDDESLSRLRGASEIFNQLVKEVEDDKERKRFESWRLACLANDPDRQENAARYCKEILGRDRTHPCSIIWSIARKFDIKLTSSEKAIVKLINNKDSEIPHILALISIYLSSGSRRAKKAIRILEDTKAIFEVSGAYALWLFWYAQSLVFDGDPETALKMIDSSGLSVDLRYSKSMALRQIARKTSNWHALLAHLESSYKETNEPAFLLESCELMAYRKEWAYVADRAELIVNELQTADVLRLAVIAANNAKQYELCLKLLDKNRIFFREQKLPSELRRIRAHCCQSLGILPQAIAEAESLVQDEPTTDHLIDLAQYYSLIGNLKSLAIVGRKLFDRYDLSPDNALRMSYFTRWEDKDLAIAFWQRAAQQGVPDNLLGIALELGYQLGLDAELTSLLSRMAQLGQQGKAGIQMVTTEDIIAFAKQRREDGEHLDKIYRAGVVPIHIIAARANRPLIDFYHFFLTQNETSPDPLRQAQIFIRHGGRPLTHGVPKNLFQSHICMDITSVLLSMHLSILDMVEKTFHPICIPSDTVPALIHIRDRVSHQQPKRVEAYQQIINLVQKGNMGVVDYQIPPGCETSFYSDILGESWITLYEHTYANKGYLVDFYSFKKNLTNLPKALQDTINAHLISCRTIVDSLREEGPLSEKEYEYAIIALGNEGVYDPHDLKIKQGVRLVCHANIPEVLANAGLLQTICERFSTFIEKNEFELCKAGLEEYALRFSLVDWLGILIDKLSRGIDTRTYQIIPYPIGDKRTIDKTQVDSLESQCLLTLLSFSPCGKEVVLSDDRYVNGYFRRDNIPIIGINDILKVLLEKKAIDLSGYYEKICTLRAANARFIPVEKDEILYHLKQAKIENGVVIETRALRILRRYIAACLYQGDSLQRPPLPEGAPNDKGELPFVVGLLRAVNDSIVEVWADPKENEHICQARSEWIIENIYVDYLGVFRTISLPRSEEDEKYSAAIGIAGLMSQAIAFSAPHLLDSISLRRRYFKWLSDRLLQKRFDANPDLIISVADYLKKLIFDSKLNTQKGKEDNIMAILLQAFYEDMPDQIREELKHDEAFMASIGLKLILTSEIEGLKFNSDEYWYALAEAINGRDAKITTIDAKVEARFFPTEDVSDGESINFENLATGERKKVLFDILGVLSESATKRESTLRRNRMWFDCPTAIFEQIIAEIASTDNIEQRVKKTLHWRNTSAVLYYKEIAHRVQQKGEFEFADCIPPSAAGLTRYIRIDAKTEPGAIFEESLSKASQMLLSEEGLFETVNRLAGLPVPLPSNLVNAITALSAEDKKNLIKKLLRISGSPISKIHFIHILTHLADVSPIYKRLAFKAAARLLSPEGTSEFEAYVLMLKWVNEEFNYWPDTQQLSVPVRIALIWSHTHHLFNIFMSAGAPVSWIRDIFGKAQRRLPSEIFRRNPKYWFDITHPWRVYRQGFLLTGLAYAFDKLIPHSSNQRLRDLITTLAFHTVGETSAPTLLLLRDPLRAKDNLRSFLAMDHGKASYSLLATENSRSLESSTLTEIVEQALERLAVESDQSFDWGLIYSIIGDLPTSQQIAEQLKKAIQLTDFIELFKNDPLYGGLALKAASSQVRNLFDREGLIVRMKKQLVEVARLNESKMLEEPNIFKQENDLNGPLKISEILLESALNLSLIKESTGSVADEFAGIVTQLVDAGSSLSNKYHPAIQRLCEELPLSEAKYLWPLLIRLRAN
jgi:hypothetical protein